MITFTAEATQILRKLDALPQRMLRAIASALNAANALTVSHIQQFRMTGKGPFPPSMHRLGVKTNRLRGSLRAVPAIIAGQSVISAIGSNVKYAGIHEFGGVTGPHEIRARKGGALRFVAGGRTIFRKSVKHPGSRIPARAPIRSGIEDQRHVYSRMISAAIVTAWNKEHGVA